MTPPKQITSHYITNKRINPKCLIFVNFLKSNEMSNRHKFIFWRYRNSTHRSNIAAEISACGNVPSSSYFCLFRIWKSKIIYCALKSMGHSVSKPHCCGYVAWKTCDFTNSINLAGPMQCCDFHVGRIPKNSNAISPLGTHEDLSHLSVIA